MIRLPDKAGTEFPDKTVLHHHRIDQVHGFIHHTEVLQYKPVYHNPFSLIKRDKPGKGKAPGVRAKAFTLN
jgi:hypothetical protein